jgi:hypothetical protein
MRKRLTGTTALVTASLLLAATAACTQAPAAGSSDEPAKEEQPIKLELGGYLHQGFAVGGTSDSE